MLEIKVNFLKISQIHLNMSQISFFQKNSKIMIPTSTGMAGGKRCHITGQMDMNR